MHREPTLSSRTWRGRYKAALLLLAAGAAAAAMLAASTASANPSQMIGLDMTPTSGSSPAGTGVDTCVQVGVGDSFEADVFVTNVQNLTNYDLRVDFDPAILSLNKEAIDHNHMLTKDGGGAIFPLSEEEMPGRWLIAAAETRNPDSGSGTLVRLTFEALKKGTSTVSISGSPVVLRPALQGLQGPTKVQVNIGDSNGDGFWDGGLSSGKVAVDQSCTGSTPIVTPPATNVPNTTPKPGVGSATPAPNGDDPGPGATDAPSGGSDGGGGGDSGDSGGDSGGDGDSPDIVENIDPDGDDSDGGAAGNVQDPEDASEDTAGGVRQGSDGGSSSSTTILLAVVAAALAAAAGAVLLWLRIASGRE